MGRSNVGRTLLCASALGLVAAAAPQVASAVPEYTVSCYGATNSNSPAEHEINETETEGYCTANASTPDSFSIHISGSPEAGNAVPAYDHTSYPSVSYTATASGRDGYSFYAVDNEGHQVSPSITVYTNNVPRTNGTPRCLGQQSDNGAYEDLGIGQERFAGGCFDDEGENGPLTIQVVQSPSRGTLRVDTSDPTRPLVYYRATCSGADDYSFTASDGENTSAIFSGTVTNAVGTPCTAPTPGASAPPAKAAAPAATFSLKSVPSSVTADSRGTVTIPVTGTPGSAGSVAITANAPKGASASAVAKKKKRKAKKATTLSLGSKRFTVPASGVAKVQVKLSGKGLKALKKAKKLSVKVTVKTDKTTVTKTVVLKAPKAKVKKKSKK